MSVELLRRAWDALDSFKQAYPENWNEEDQQVMDDLLKADLNINMQPEPEPVAWMYNTMGEARFAEKLNTPGMHRDESVPLYTAPPQREWQGLTEEEVDATIDEIAIDSDDKVLYPMVDFAHAIEAKLKEKNT